MSFCCKEAFSSVVSANSFSNSRRKQTLFFSRRITTACRSPPSFDVFINHRGMDTKRNVAALLYDRFVHLNLNPFLDYKSMKPGEELKEVIETAIRDCKVGVAIFSPNYCTSHNCLHELALMMECEKKIIPIFYDIKTSDLVLVDNGGFPAKQLHRFGLALELAKDRVGISFDSSKGDWSDLIKRVSDRVVEILMELEATGGKSYQHHE
ncbi:TIR-only protein-like [Macadamia integrifolia]|uniref:TIR-only protein-like n=1 Tax=Macadamia integrifolia TaxID=60698 RepID=UPI001C4F0642|nr:TIR-only protein-like [Macadamia integrifolia]